MSDFDGFNEAYKKYFDDDPLARTTVAVTGLLHTIVEIEAIIAIP